MTSLRLLRYNSAFREAHNPSPICKAVVGRLQRFKDVATASGNQNACARAKIDEMDVCLPRLISSSVGKLPFA